MDPAAATRLTIKQNPLSSFIPIHIGENLGTLACTRYISVGKYTVNGQNEKAPSKPTMELKKGSNIAITVVNITYTVLHMARNRFILYVPTNGILTRYSFAMKLLCGHRFLHQPSTRTKMGCANTCTQN